MLTADRRPQTADRRPQTADRRPQTADRSSSLTSPPDCSPRAQRPPASRARPVTGFLVSPRRVVAALARATRRALTPALLAGLAAIFVGQAAFVNTTFSAPADPLHTITIEPVSSKITEGESAFFRLTGCPSSSISVNISYVASTPEWSGGHIHEQIPCSSGSPIFPVTVPDNGVPEERRCYGLYVFLYSGEGYQVGPQGTNSSLASVIVEDDDGDWTGTVLPSQCN